MWIVSVWRTVYSGHVWSLPVFWEHPAVWGTSPSGSGWSSPGQCSSHLCWPVSGLCNTAHTHSYVTVMSQRCQSLIKMWRNLTLWAWAGSVRTWVNRPRQTSSCCCWPLQTWGEVNMSLCHLICCFYYQVGFLCCVLLTLAVSASLASLSESPLVKDWTIPTQRSNLWTEKHSVRTRL